MCRGIRACTPADGTTTPVSFPAGTLNVAHANTPSTSYSASTNEWTTYQTIDVGATTLSTVSFITSSMTGLPKNVAVRRPATCPIELTSAGLRKKCVS